MVASSDRSDRQWTIAVILAVFLGYFGAHRFYEGRIVLGVLLLLTGGGFIVGWVVDALIVLLQRVGEVRKPVQSVNAIAVGRIVPVVDLRE